MADSAYDKPGYLLLRHRRGREISAASAIGRKRARSTRAGEAANDIIASKVRR